MKTKPVNRVLWVLLVLIAAGWAYGRPVVESTSDTHLELLFDIPNIEEVTDGKGRWGGVRIPGFFSICDDSLGFSAPVRAYLVAVPEDASVTCDVSDASYYNINSYAADNVLNRLGDAASALPRWVAQIVSVGYFRDQRVAGLRIAPLVYDEETGSIRIYGRFRVTVRFGGEYGARRGARPAATTGDATYEAAYKASLLNYEQGKVWRRRPERKIQQGDYYSNSPNWIRMNVESTGVYCVTGDDLEEIGVGIGGIDPGTIRLYSGDGLPLKESLADSNPVWMRPVPVKICDGDDGSFDNADSIMFYGLGMSDWVDLYDKERDYDVYYKSFFSTYNCYWLTWGGSFGEEPRRMEQVAPPVCDGCTYYEPDAFYSRVHAERNSLANFAVRAEDGWYWQPLRTDTRSRFTADTPWPDADRPATVKVRVADWYNSESDECAEDFYRVKVYLNDWEVRDTTWRASLSSRGVVDIVAEDTDRITSSHTQQLAVLPPSSLLPPNTGKGVCGKLYMAWFEIYYWRKFTAEEDRLFFPAPDTTCIAEYNIDGFTSPSVYAFDVTDQFDVKELLGVEDTTGESFTDFTVAIHDSVREGIIRRYAVVSRNALLKPIVISEASVSNIRYAPGASYCVVTHEDFLEAASTISNFRGGEVVTTRQIYDEFAWGVTDVTSIRDFLRWRYESGPLAWVLLLGDASWDYKGYRTGDPYPNYVPSYERRYVPPFGSPYNTDDWFAYLVPVKDDSIADYPTVGISRLPASSPEEAAQLVEKTIDYVSNPELGTWQNKVILVADDDHISIGCEPSSPHTDNVEELSDLVYPHVFEHIKIYLTEYPMETTQLKPAAKADFLKYLNRGALVTNFVGHGDQYRWTQEEVFNPAAVDLVHTGRRETFLIAASCNVSKFDEPKSASVAEELLRRPGGGTIGSLASTYLAFPDENQVLNLNVVWQLFPSGDKYPTVPIADAVALAKWLTMTETSGSRRYWQNNEIYALFGDPMLELAAPRLDVVFDMAVPDTLLRKSPYEFTASVHDQEGVVSWSDEWADIRVREAEDTSGYQSCYPGRFFDYEIAGSEVFRGTSEIENGVFHSRFFLAGGAREGWGATVRCFATDGQTSASGVLDGLLISGEGYSDDDVGPDIELVHDGEPVVSGDTLAVGARIGIRLSDESGVAIKGKSEFIPSVSVAYDDVERINLADSVFAVDGDFTQSEVTFIVPPLTDGEHELSVAAFDNLNNLTIREYTVHVGSQVSAAGNVVYAYPNPMHDVCRIIWDYDNDRHVEVKATIYTVSGREVWSGTVSGRSPYLEVVWDGTDMVGDPVANGTYLVVVEATAPSEPGFSTADTIVLALIR